MFRERIPMAGGAMVDQNDATGPVNLTVATDDRLSGTWRFIMHHVFDESMNVAGVKAKYHSVYTYAMTDGTIAGTVCNLSLTSGAVRQLSCVGACGDGAPAPLPAGMRAFGAPRVQPGKLTWQFKANAADGSYTDSFTIAVTPTR